MNSNQVSGVLLEKHWSRRFVVGLVALSLSLASGLASSLILGLAPAALAQSGTYVPPRTGSPPDARTIAGTRGGECAQNLDTELTVLAPYSHTGQTASTHPTFAWYVPDNQPLSVEFRLYAHGADGHLQPQPLYEVILESSQGIMSHTLPAEQTGLSIGQSYYWQVALLCDPAHPSEDLVVGTKIDVVASAEPGSLWYDLLGQALTQTENQEVVLNLLSDLATIEQMASTQVSESNDPSDVNQEEKQADQRRDFMRQSQQLLQIVEVEQQ
ncbi:DUF928 domain-containing protein [Thermocoleostomius sinensis]|uniref:DUF928 domain-containing protein n=1 Tax=Thermocoleostomius sinensis A174 TaxID=2016057 RepID=A0A9E8ZFU0_9CYAN|nr:DUF928 domain-containing protein [Thermocoleostomius sinensis]WAL62031.1 DUF928 domain-containing protein [Thermocoleostomius sinensis A174]